MNLISEFSTPVSMSLRLFGNILSGTVMTGLIYGLLPKVLTLIWYGCIAHLFGCIFRCDSDVCILYVDDVLCLGCDWGSGINKKVKKCG